MTLPVSCEVPFVPGMSVNQMLAPKRGGGLRHSDDYDRALAHVAEHVMVGSAGHRPTSAPVSVHIECFFPDQRPRDLDNLGKILLDGLEGYVLTDDSQVDELWIRRAGVDSEEPRIEVTVRAHNDTSG